MDKTGPALKELTTELNRGPGPPSLLFSQSPSRWDSGAGGREGPSSLAEGCDRTHNNINIL